MSEMQLDELSGMHIAPVDVFICCASFEGRSSLLSLSIPKYLIKRSVVFSNEDYEEEVFSNKEAILRQFGEKAELAMISTLDPILTADRMYDVLLGMRSDNSIHCFVDITTFTHEALLILVRILRNLLDTSDKLTFGYVPAKEYAVGLPDEEKWLSKGIDHIRSVLGYPGSIRPSRKTHLIVLVGFEQDRVEKLVDQYEPSVVSLGYGPDEDSISSVHHQLNIKLFKKLCSKYPSVNDFVFSCVDPKETEEAVLRQVDKYKDFNTVISGMNTKISTIGVAMAAIKNKNVQVCYAHTTQYNVEHYSSADSNCIIIDGSDVLV